MAVGEDQGTVLYMRWRCVCAFSPSLSLFFDCLGPQGRNYRRGGRNADIRRFGEDEAQIWLGRRALGGSTPTNGERDEGGTDGKNMTQRMVQIRRNEKYYVQVKDSRLELV